jgi:hypothetical protein
MVESETYRERRRRYWRRQRLSGVDRNSRDALSIGIDTSEIADVYFSIQMALALRVQFDRLSCGNVLRNETVIQDPEVQWPA